MFGYSFVLFALWVCDYFCQKSFMGLEKECYEFHSRNQHCKYQFWENKLDFYLTFDFSFFSLDRLLNLIFEIFSCRKKLRFENTAISESIDTSTLIVFPFKTIQAYCCVKWPQDMMARISFFFAIKAIKLPNGYANNWLSNGNGPEGSQVGICLETHKKRQGSIWSSGSCWHFHQKTQ